MAQLTGPITGGRHGWPFGRPLVDLDRYGYVEEEWFLDGEATSHRAVGEQAREGHWEAEPATTAPFRTRLLVYRPADPHRMNGTAVVSWNNVTAGYELFGGESPEILEGGYVFVGVTTQKVGIVGLPPTPPGLAAWDPERYGSLSHPCDDFSYDIFTKAAAAIRDLLPGARRLIAMGASQSAGRLATYVNAIHPMSRAFDAYLVQIWFGAGTPLEVGDAVVNINQPAVDTGRRLLTGQHQLRDDLDVPVMVVNSELESIPCFHVRQPDTDRFRYWEAAGTCHVSLQVSELRAVKYERDFGTPLPVEHRMNRVPLLPLYDAAIHHLHVWVNGGPPPPAQPRIEFAGDPPEIVRDEHGIARGGIRLPQVEVPIARNSALPLGEGIYALLWGSSQPFPPEKVHALYGDAATYLARFEEAARAAEKAGVLLPRDVEALIEEAGASYPR
jgi:hypothetical protein